ncbi:hypothetical protein DENSPDRAFT_794049 [Dentipellis sp. KUC8613]|nr:hypothetical protein DENSPDRAFT_794049 [Dentipellis sp. KUC8613]
MASSRLYSYVLSFLDRTSFTVTALTAASLLYTRSAGIAYFCAGGVACSVTVKLLKRVLRQPRPEGRSQKRTYGMPSTHAATISYYGMYIPLACLYLPSHASLPAHPSFRAFVTLVAVPWASLIAVSRIWLGHHTWPQVLVGCSYGCLFALGWFALWVYGGLNEYGNIAESYVSAIIKEQLGYH